jgi:hypothetical protein
MRLSGVIMLILAFAVAKSAQGNIALLDEEPYDFFGSINPTGHSAIYLNHVCAETPIRLRRCEAGETGVVISRYSRILNFDWIAMPLLPYLYAVDRVEDIPVWAESSSIQRLRAEYAEAHLGVLSSANKKSDAKKVWPQLLGVAYQRKIYVFDIETTQEQDDRLIDALNGGVNQSRFNLFTNNCADFSRNVINSYYPRVVRRSITADVGITTPKHIAKTLVAYAHRVEELDLTEFVIPQIPGNIARSHPIRGVVESLLMTKKYAIPIAIFQPYVMAGIAITYLTRGRFEFGNHAPLIPLEEQVGVFVGETANPVVRRNEVKMTMNAEQFASRTNEEETAPDVQ